MKYGTHFVKRGPTNTANKGNILTTVQSVATTNYLHLFELYKRPPNLLQVLTDKE